MRKLRKRNAPKRTLAPPDLEHAKSAVVNSLSSASGQRLIRMRLATVGLRRPTPGRMSPAAFERKMTQPA